jgi:hypothetical protein
MEIIIGRKGQQHIAITDLSVSREHCKLTSNSDGTYTLENLSANGTFVDGRSIVRSVVTLDTVIQLGATFRVSVKELLPVVSKQTKSAEPQKITVDPHQQEYEAKFRRLKYVYDKYTADKIAIQKEAGMNNFYRMLPMTLLSLVGLGATAIPALANIAPVLGIVGIGLLIFSLVKSYNGSKDNPEKMEALNKQFMIDYVCPKCGNFLGYVPYEALVNKSVCSFCKCKWV